MRQTIIKNVCLAAEFESLKKNEKSYKSKINEGPVKIIKYQVVNILSRIDWTCPIQ